MKYCHKKKKTRLRSTKKKSIEKNKRKSTKISQY